jgi:hypothetical protein
VDGFGRSLQTQTVTATRTNHPPICVG